MHAWIGPHRPTPTPHPPRATPPPQRGPHRAQDLSTDQHPPFSPPFPPTHAHPCRREHRIYQPSFQPPPHTPPHPLTPRRSERSVCTSSMGLRWMPTHMPLMNTCARGGGVRRWHGWEV